MATTARTQHREPRPPRRCRAPAPPLELVAAEALKLDPASPVAAYLRSRPEVAARMLRRSVLAFIETSAPADELPQAPISDLERQAAARFNVGERTVRRWRTGR